jgi:hypothetical protein
MSDIPASVVDNFKLITGIGEEQARFFLEAAGGNFEAALGMFYGEERERGGRKQSKGSLLFRHLTLAPCNRL